jgi:hypothetical protein
VEWFATAMLLVTTVFSYMYEQYTTAVVAAACFGIVGGMTFARAVWRR